MADKPKIEDEQPLLPGVERRQKPTTAPRERRKSPRPKVEGVQATLEDIEKAFLEAESHPAPQTEEVAAVPGVEKPLVRKKDSLLAPDKPVEEVPAVETTAVRRPAPCPLCGSADYNLAACAFCRLDLGFKKKEEARIQRQQALAQKAPRPTPTATDATTPKPALPKDEAEDDRFFCKECGERGGNTRCGYCSHHARYR